MLTTIIDGVEYELATTLRVAYMVQNEHNHKPYTEIFEELGNMPLEDQIGIIYTAFKCANPKEVTNKITQGVFLNQYLDNMTLKEVMNQLQDIIKGIMGTDALDSADSDATKDSVDTGEEQGK